MFNSFLLYPSIISQMFKSSVYFVSLMFQSSVYVIPQCLILQFILLFWFPSNPSKFSSFSPNFSVSLVYLILKYPLFSIYLSLPFLSSSETTPNLKNNYLDFSSSVLLPVLFSFQIVTLIIFFSNFIFQLGHSFNRKVS